MKKKNNISKIFAKKINGIKMIEASAGTGKTFTIIFLYLKILLGIIKSKKKYSVQNILIITYTKNAVKEIRQRLEKNIYNFYLDCLSKKTNNQNYIKIFKKIKNFKKAIQRLKIAYQNIHHASIYTIHGFCQYILKKENYNYEYLINLKKKNDKKLYETSIFNFWRNFFYPQNKEISNIIFQYWKNPNALLKQIHPWLKIKSKIFTNTKIKKKNIIQVHQQNIRKIKKFKKKWKFLNIKLNNFFLKNKLNKKIYHEKNFKKWINKIQEWTQSKTKNYDIPKELYHFSEKKINQNIDIKNKKKIIFLKIIDKFLKKEISLKEIILIHTLKEIPKICKKIQKKNFFYDNLIISLENILKKDKNLSRYIQKKFPIAFIDEFQDTDIQQYKLFQKIYNKKNSTLILVGDPKQSIYNFRGADIFFYLKIRSKISDIYTLKKNWRSSKNMIESINLLFTRIKNVFLFKKIKYVPLLSSKESKKKKFFIKKKEQSSIKIWLQKGSQKTPFEYNNWISKKCAKNIYYLIQKIKKSEAILKTNTKNRKLKIEDICILVKNYEEFKILKKELLKLNIQSYYTSFNKSIFQTLEVKEMYFILKSILYLSNEKYFYRALSTSIICTNIHILNKIKKNYSLLSHFKNIFLKYQKILKKKGILNLIKKIISKSDIYKNYFFYNKFKEKICNLIHLGEILEKKINLKQEISFIIFWIKKKINKIDNDNKNYQQKLYSNNKKIINITTIYKSKGLQYPIIWIPFISNFSYSKKLIYHDRKKYNTYINLKKSKKKMKLEDEERLSEDIRLLYVAITRGIFQCNLGVSPLVQKKNIKKTDFHKSGLGYILQKGQSMTAKQLYCEIKKILIKNKIQLILKDKSFKRIKKKKKNLTEKKVLKICYFNRKFEKNYNTSYTQILKQKKKKNYKNKEKYYKNFFKKKKIKKFNQYTFPTGKKYGKFLHKILEKINFHKKLNINFIKKELKKIKISKKWNLILKNWIKSIIHHPFSIKKINLLSSKNNFFKEMEFYIPLKKNINFFLIHSILKKKYKKNKFLFKKCKQEKGIFKGFIDLVCKIKEKYYFIDYKSDFLGNKEKNYHYKKIKKHFFKKKYNIQYYLYAIALHRFLKNKIKNYDFKKHFGGGFYLFLRGMNGENYNQGVFFLIPKYHLMKTIDNCFFKKIKNINFKK